MASGSLGSIFVDLLLNTGRFEDGLNRSKRALKGTTSVWTSDLRNAGSSFKGLGSQVDSAIASINSSITSLGAGIAAAFSVTEIARYADTWKQLQGRLAIVDGGMGNVSDTTQQLFDIAQKTRQPLEAVVNFYARLNQFVPQAERAQYDLLGVTQSVANALAITGETSESATAAMVQFTQAIGTNFQSAGQELRSIQEQAPRLAIALQNSLGGGTKSLQQLKDEGKLTRESVLNALSSMSAEAQKMQAEFDKVPLTIAQSFTRLDNAFLKFIGQSQAITQGTTSIALGISKLAENFDLVASAAIGLGVVFVGRMVPSLVATTVSFLALNVGSLQVQLTLARMEGVSGAAAIALLGLGAAGRVASAAISALGGPIGVALIGFYTAYTIESSKAAEAQGIFNSTLAEITGLSQQFKTASADMRKQIVEDVYARISALEIEKDTVGKVLAQYNTGSTISDVFKLSKDTIGSWVGLSESPRAAIEKFKVLNTTIADAKKQLQALIDLGTSGKVGTGGVLDEKTLKELQALYDKNREYILGLNSATLKYMDTAAELKRLLDAKKITVSQYSEALVRLKADTDGSAKAAKELDSIYDKHRDVILGMTKAQLDFNDTQADLQKLLAAGKISQEEYNASVGRAQAEYEKASKAAGVWAIDVAETAKEASRNIQKALADFLFDPFKDGLGGMLTGFEEMLRRMVAEAAASQILSGLFGQGGFGAGGKSSGGMLSGFTNSIGSFFSGFFADGGTIPPGQFGIVGENGPELAMGGAGGKSIVPLGGANITVNVVNNAGAQVSTNARRGSQGMELDVMIDQAVAKNISTPGSNTNQALKGFNSQSLTRR